MVGRPSTIHSASARPAPPALAIPAELKPAPTKKRRSSGASPRMNWLSGVKLSGPLTRRWTSALASAGTRTMALVMRISNCCQSSFNRVKAKSSGTSRESQGLATGSKPPMTRPPTSSLK